MIPLAPWLTNAARVILVFDILLADRAIELWLNEHAARTADASHAPSLLSRDGWRIPRRFVMMLLIVAVTDALRSASLNTARAVIETTFLLAVAFALVALKSTRLWAYGLVELGVAVALCVFAPGEAGTETTPVAPVTVVVAIYLAVRGVEHVWRALTQGTATVAGPPHLVSSRSQDESRVA